MIKSAGYYIIERDRLCGQEEKEAETLSIIEFLRRAKRKNLPEQTYVYGLEDAVEIWGEGYEGYLKSILKPLLDLFLQKGTTVAFIIEGRIIGEAKPAIEHGNVRINLARIFSLNRLEPITKGCIYASPNIP